MYMSKMQSYTTTIQDKCEIDNLFLQISYQNNFKIYKIIKLKGFYPLINNIFIKLKGFYPLINNIFIKLKGFYPLINNDTYMWV